MNRTILVSIILAVFVIISAVAVAVILMPKKCGSKVIPARGHCQVSDLVCDATSGDWYCSKCDEGYQGKYCRCKTSDGAPVVNVCSTSKIPVCNEATGQLLPQFVSTCTEIDDYLSGYGLDVQSFCGCPCVD